MSSPFFYRRHSVRTLMCRLTLRDPGLASPFPQVGG
jgi:hypothetical protein